MIFYTGDLHLGHEGIIGIDGRPFEDAGEMDETLIRKWNQKVSDTDDVYIIGDLFGRETDDPGGCLDRLKGRKHLVIGNHDGRLVQKKGVISRFESVGSIMQIRDCKRSVVLCHYPIIMWNRMEFGSLHVFGHIHNRKPDMICKWMKSQKTAFNAGCMINGYEPVSLEELETNNLEWLEDGGTEPDVQDNSVKIMKFAE